MTWVHAGTDRLRDRLLIERELRRTQSLQGFGAFLERFGPSLDIGSGRAVGLVYPLDQSLIRIGRGPGVDLSVDDQSLDREHALIFFEGGAFFLRTYGKRGSEPVRATRLLPDFGFRLGSVCFRYRLTRGLEDLP